MSDNHWEYYKDTAGEWRSRFVASNGRVLFAASEGYKNEADMLAAIDVLEYAIRETVGIGSFSLLPRRRVDA